MYVYVQAKLAKVHSPLLALTMNRLWILLLLSGLGLANGLCNGPERSAPFNVNSENECAEACTDQLECSSYFFKLTSGEAGLCQLLDKFNDNFLSETITVPTGYIMKTCLRSDESYYYITPPTYDVAGAALAMGFDTPMTIASLGVTRYLKKLTGGDLSLSSARKRCAADGGSLLQEYNQEVSDAVNAIYGPTIPKRYMGMHITMREDNSAYDIIWDNGQVDWGNTQSGSCPKYSSWVSSDWTKLQTEENVAHIIQDVNDGMKPGDGNAPPYLICQYYGANVATGKVAGAPNYLPSTHTPANALDGNWYNYMYHSNDDTSNANLFWYVDLGEEYAIKHVVWSGRDKYGFRMRNLKFFLSYNRPTAPLDESKLTPCASFPYQSATVNALAGMTCNKWTLGRFFILQNNHPAIENIQLNQIAIRGFKLTDMA